MKDNWNRYGYPEDPYLCELYQTVADFTTGYNFKLFHETNDGNVIKKFGPFAQCLAVELMHNWINNSGARPDVQWLAEKLATSTEEVVKTLEAFAEAGYVWLYHNSNPCGWWD